MNIKQEKNRVDWVDYAKCIGIYMVIIGHLQLSINNIILQKWIYTFHMALFFVLSALFFNEKNSLQQTIKNGFKTLIVPYIILYITSVLIFPLIDLLYNRTFSLETYSIKMLKHTAGMFIASYPVVEKLDFALFLNGSLWFLVGLFFCRLLYQFFYIKLKGFKGIIILNILALLYVYIVNNRFDINLLWSMDAAIMAIPFYTVGHLFSKFKSIELNTRRLFLLFTITFVALGLLFFIFKENKFVLIYMARHGGSMFFCYTAGILGSFMVFFLAMIISKYDIPILKYWGRNSIIILGAHFIIIKFVRYFYYGWIRDPFANYSELYLGISQLMLSAIVLLLCSIPIFLFRQLFPSIFQAK